MLLLSQFAKTHEFIQYSLSNPQKKRTCLCLKRPLKTPLSKHLYRKVLKKAAQKKPLSAKQLTKWLIR